MHPPLLPVESSKQSSRPKLDIQLHTKYWQRCLKSLLPTEYQSTDSNRVMLAFLILAALDVLGCGASTMPMSENNILRDWVLSCQHPNGGFCGSPNHKYPEGYYCKGRDVDPANLGSTFFAILSLGFVGGLEKVNRAKTLNWLKKLQRKDGSFGELVDGTGRIGGGRDMRYCHFASGIRRMLKGGELPRAGDEKFDDIDVEALVRHIRGGETYDGGIAESSEHEAHAGYTYCAIASLSFLDRLASPSKAENQVENSISGLQNASATTKWLAARQVAHEEDDEDESEDEGIGPAESNAELPREPPSLAKLSLEDAQQIGCNGRCNKKADTCYCYYVGASLLILGKERLINKEGFHSFLLEKTQHRIGGFGKCPGYPPDIYHSYLGLAILSIMGEPGLKPIDPVFCTTVEARECLEKSIQTITAAKKSYWKNGVLGVASENDDNYDSKVSGDEGAPKWLQESRDRDVQQGDNQAQVT